MPFQVISARRGGAAADAVVGAINELVLQLIEQDRVDRLPDLVAPAAALVRAVTGVAPDSRP